LVTRIQIFSFFSDQILALPQIGRWETLACLPSGDASAIAGGPNLLMGAGNFPILNIDKEVGKKTGL
jgi:hypothetical protein